MPPEASAMEAEAETEGGAEVPAFSEEVRTAFQPPADSATGVTGTLRLLVPTQEGADEGAGPARLHVELAGLAQGQHDWHVYDGPCGVEGGGLALPLSATDDNPGVAGPLQADARGSVEAEVDAPPLDRLWTEAGNYSVRVFAGTGVDAGPVVACANL